MNTFAQGSKEASFWTREGDKVRCGLCPHRCRISAGKRGLCGVRENRNGTLYSLIFGKASSIHPDPIEKKPLYHFLPGTTAISFGSIGCNLFCLYCQNWSISKAKYGQFGLTDMTPEDVVRYAKDAGASSVSWTYNEPTIWHEFTTLASRAAHDSGLKTSYVTNGYINEEPLRDLKGVIDAMNIDVKAFSEGFYERVCGGRLAPVLRTCELAHEIGIHIELTYLVIPEHNDSDDEMSKFCAWAAEKLGKEVPVHFSAFHPDYKMTKVPKTPEKTLLKAYDLARRAGLEFVYLGNIWAGERDDTYCPKCGTKVIDREGFSVRQTRLKGDRCGKCGAPLNLVI
ncbi:MAG: AmmeMemoRadiSam system radical SAM enzyme [Candidatus Thermoplasmatota archaeon]|nr:AmmeMemoRadiSam system radical SAM enzyme [Candidatus Thermoplasmatota archaeon]